ncbi:MAG: hypothetical protein ACJ754_14355 [Pyrinomonadaceae bacterium]
MCRAAGEAKSGAGGPRNGGCSGAIEAFYWYADARINRSIGGNVRLVLAKEAAFTTPLPSIGNQITFDRIRVRIDNLTAGATYTITHPFGVITATADADGGIIINSSLKTTTTASTSVAPTTATTTQATTADGFTPTPQPAGRPLRTGPEGHLPTGDSLPNLSTAVTTTFLTSLPAESEIDLSAAGRTE